MQQFFSSLELHGHAPTKGSSQNKYVVEHCNSFKVQWFKGSAQQASQLQQCWTWLLNRLFFPRLRPILLSETSAQITERLQFCRG